jgi:hypothetical protein
MKKKMLFVDFDKYEDAKQALRNSGLNWYNQTSVFYVHGMSVVITLIGVGLFKIIGNALHLF